MSTSVTPTFENYLRVKLKCAESYYDSPNPNSILEYGVICHHDNSFFCEHRLQWLIDALKQEFNESHELV